MSVMTTNLEPGSRQFRSWRRVGRHTIRLPRARTAADLRDALEETTPDEDLVLVWLAPAAHDSVDSAQHVVRGGVLLQFQRGPRMRPCATRTPLRGSK